MRRIALQRVQNGTHNFFKHGLGKTYVPVRCNDCKSVFKKRHDTLKSWGGRCVTCKNRVIAKMPSVVKAKRVNAQRHVLAQGGIPNARKFDGSQKGASHWNWQGGITPERIKAYFSKEYQDWRRTVFERDDYTCQGCGERGGRLNADHIKPYSLFPALRFDVFNGRTLCADCHRKMGWFGRQGKTFREATFKLT